MNAASRTRGGTTLLVASLLLLVATLVEGPLIGASALDPALFTVFLVAFSLSLVGYLVAGLLLAAGTSHAAARVGLILFGVLWLVAQGLFLFGAYFTPSDALLLTSTVLSVVQLLGGLVAAIVIGARGLILGVGRWSLLVGILVSAVTGGIASSAPSAVLLTVMHSISAIGLALVGVTYLVSRSGNGTAARAR